MGGAICLPPVARCVRDRLNEMLPSCFSVVDLSYACFSRRVVSLPSSPHRIRPRPPLFVRPYSGLPSDLLASLSSSALPRPLRPHSQPDSACAADSVSSLVCCFEGAGPRSGVAWCSGHQPKPLWIAPLRAAFRLWTLWRIRSVEEGGWED